MDAGQSAPEFEPSRLGTKTHWDDAYERELNNFNEFGDTGEVWFEETVRDKLQKWIAKKLPNISVSESSVLDLGSGNGLFLIEMAELGFEKLCGVDYSEKAVELAISIAAKEGHAIEYAVLDILAGPMPEGRQFSIVNDKGTFDAICLSEGSNRDAYIRNVHSMVHADGYFVITSCNWSKEELPKIFGSHFEVVAELNYPVLTFGGKTGSAVSTLAFRPK